MPPNKQQPKTMPEAMLLAVNNILSGKWTATAGSVISYNQSTRRASIMPIPRAKYLDGRTEDHPECLNVPVIFQSGGGWTLALNLERNDPVLLVFCRRGIQNFKETFRNCDPSGGMMDIDSAVAIAGFGALSISPPSGISLQKNDGSVKVDVSSTKVEVKVGALGGATFNQDGSVVFANGASINPAGQFVSAAGVNIDTHLHHNGTGDTGSPVIPS
jgi:hypothetical protein